MRKNCFESELELTTYRQPVLVWNAVLCVCVLTHWGRVTHLWISKLTSIASDNGLSPGRRQAIIWTNAGILLIGPLGTNFREILSEIHTFSFKKMRLKMSSGKWRPFCLGLNVLNRIPRLEFFSGGQLYKFSTRLVSHLTTRAWG